MKGHVLIVVQNLPVPLDRRVWMEAQALRTAGYEVSVICPLGGYSETYEELQGVQIHRYPEPHGQGSTLDFVWEFGYCWSRAAWLAARIHRKNRIDAVQACNPPDTYFLLGLIMQRLGAKFVYDQHDLCPEIYSARFDDPNPALLSALHALERRTYRTADHVITTNESFRSVAVRRGSLKPDNITIVRSGPRASLMQRDEPVPELKNGRQHLLCYLGIMGPQDGVDIALYVAHELIVNRGRDLQFAMLGFGDCFHELQKQSADLGLVDHVTFTGRADDTMIRDYLSTATIGLSPDPQNQMNDLCTMNKTLEYMAHELPVVAFDLTETRVSAGAASVYAQPNEVLAFADEVDRLLDDETRRKEMGRIGRERIENELSWEHSAKAYVEVYDNLLGPS